MECFDGTSFLVDMVVNSDDCSAEWQGPVMVTQGFWNPSLQTEDSVVCVYGFGDVYVAMGTLSGRCLLYRQIGGSHFKLWECILPYSIHGICHVGDTNSKIRLLVSTRMSIHVLDLYNLPATPDNFSAESARLRLHALLQERRQAPAQSPTLLPQGSETKVISEGNAMMDETDEKNTPAPFNSAPEQSFTGNAISDRIISLNEHVETDYPDTTDLTDAVHALPDDADHTFDIPASHITLQGEKDDSDSTKNDKQDLPA